jgi:hypothetical protein
MKTEIKPLLPREKAVELSWTNAPKHVEGRQRLLLDVLQIVVQDHLLANQTLNGKQFDDLILGPHGKLALLCPHLQQDASPSQMRAEVIRCYSGLLKE